MMFATRVFTGPAWLTSPQNNWIRVIARAKEHVSLTQAQAGMTATFRQFNRDIVLPLVTNERARQSVSARTIRLQPGRAGLLEMDNVKPTLFALLGLVGLVLLIACVNVLNLMVARAERLHRQTAISMALGTTRAHFWRQSTIDSLVICAGGVGLGLLLAVWMRGLLLQLVPGHPELDITMDSRVFGASVVIGVLTTLMLAFVTAHHTTRVGVAGALKNCDLTARLWLRKGLIVAQLALSMLVLVAASLFARTLSSLHAVDPGFDREHVLIAATATDGYSPERTAAFYARLLHEVRAVPGITSAALANDEPLRVRTGWTVSTRPDPKGPPQALDVSVVYVSPDYFTTMGIPMLKGRDFDERDHVGTAATPVVVNERFAARQLPAGSEPIGASFGGTGAWSSRLSVSSATARRSGFEIRISTCSMSRATAVCCTYGPRCLQPPSSDRFAPPSGVSILRCLFSMFGPSANRSISRWAENGRSRSSH
jgi:hypothetical protein